MNAIPSRVLNIAPALADDELRRLDLLALRNGATAEAMAAFAVKRLLKRAEKPRRHVFRLRMPEHARRKLEEHARALGCKPGELAAFLFSKKESRPRANLNTTTERSPAAR